LDWLRSVLFSGFPWMDLGYGFWRTSYLVQTADLFGHYFLTFIIVLSNTAFFLLLTGRERRVGLLATCIAFTVIIASWVYGYFRIVQIEETIAKSEVINFGVVQGNIDQSMKWEPAEQQRTVDTYLTKSISLLDLPDPPQLVVWPETALPFYPSRNPLFEEVLRLARERKIALLTGSPWFEIEDVEKRIVNFYNGALLIPSESKKIDSYYKSHLVPFGEYVPLRNLLFFLAPLVETVGDFTPGKVEKPLSHGGADCGVLICFESIFPDITRKWVHAGANVLVNLTNDAWYGRSSAPAHSMAMSVVRAVESRRSLVRAANTGVSGFVDPLGRVSASSQIFVKWAQNMNVTLMDKISFHSRFGYLFGPFCFAVTMCMAAFRLLRRRSAEL
jgi:apolipoprotein N-acyltransferase